MLSLFCFSNTIRGGLKMGESSSNVYYILCDVRLSWLTYL